MGPPAVGTTLQGSSTVGITSGVGVVPGQTVAGPGLAPGTKVTRALNIHIFVKFDEFLMNLSPNSIRDRQKS